MYEMEPPEPPDEQGEAGDAPCHYGNTPPGFEPPAVIAFPLPHASSESWQLSQTFANYPYMSPFVGHDDTHLRVRLKNTAPSCHFGGEPTWPWPHVAMTPGGLCPHMTSRPELGDEPMTDPRGSMVGTTGSFGSRSQEVSPDTMGFNTSPELDSRSRAVWQDSSPEVPATTGTRNKTRSSTVTRRPDSEQPDSELSYDEDIYALTGIPDVMRADGTLLRAVRREARTPEAQDMAARWEERRQAHFIEPSQVFHPPPSQDHYYVALAPWNF